MMQFIYEFGCLLRRTVDGLNTEQWGVAAIILVTVGYMLLRKGHA